MIRVYARAGLAAWALAAVAGLVMLSAAPLAGQERLERASRGYFQAGYHALDLDPLNQRLTREGIPTFEEGFITLGGGGHAERGRLLIGGEGHGLLEHSETASDFKRRISGGYGFFDLGYLFARGPRTRAYALGGIGGGGIALKAEERALPSFEDVLEDPRRGSTLSTGSFLMQVAVGVDGIGRLRERGDFLRGLGVGVRAGWVFAPWSSEWTVNGAEAPGGPEATLSGGYLRVSIGGVTVRR